MVIEARCSSTCGRYMCDDREGHGGEHRDALGAGYSWSDAEANLPNTPAIMLEEAAKDLATSFVLPGDFVGDEIDTVYLCAMCFRGGRERDAFEHAPTCMVGRVLKYAKAADGARLAFGKRCEIVSGNGCRCWRKSGHDGCCVAYDEVSRIPFAVSEERSERTVVYDEVEHPTAVELA